METVHLGQELPLEDGAHILYAFNDRVQYFENLLAYVIDGISLNQVTLVIDEHIVIEQVQRCLKQQLSADAIKQKVLFANNGLFYDSHHGFEQETILEHFDQMLLQLPSPNRALRCWARVDWKRQDGMLSKLERYEIESDDVVERLGIITVCAYDAIAISAEQLITLVRRHEYFMTDTELVRSPLYSKAKPQGVFPSLSVQSKMTSELNQYKQNLDFVHMISHEVRNPLTVIAAYANIVRTTESHLTATNSDKLAAIEQYVQVIDHELTHIIETEQMLAQDLYMKLEHIFPLRTVEGVIRLMRSKASVQNVTLEAKINLEPTTSMIGNAMGLRLILSNLLSNAIKYTGEGGYVSFSAVTHGNQIQFRIRDDGVGMSEEQLHSLYRKYGKMNDNKAGLGIGLYVVKNLTDRFRGHLNVASQLGRGTEIIVGFPFAELVPHNQQEQTVS